MLIRQLKGARKSSGDIGIEIEMEGNRPLPNDVKVPWMAKSDGSLRNHGIEYVSEPLLMREVHPSMEALMKSLEGAEWIRKCPRTSTHIHINVLEHTVVEYINALVIAWMVDNVLLKHCDKFREANQYCLRLRDAEDVLRQLYSFLDSMQFNRLHEDTLKYASINIFTIHKFGTIEFRAMDGDVSVDRVTNWVKLCYQTVQSGKKFKTPDEIIKVYHKEGVDKFLASVYDDDTLKLFKGLDWNYPNLIKENVPRIYRLAHYHPNWLVWQENIAKERGSRPTRSSLSRNIPVIDDQIRSATPMPEEQQSSADLLRMQNFVASYNNPRRT